MYLYHAPANPAGESGTLTCVSCDPTGARPVGGGGVPGWYEIEAAGNGATNTFDNQPRYVFDDGRVFFGGDRLVPQDVSGGAYEYEPEGVPASEHACSPSSASGSEVFKPAVVFDVEGHRGEEGAGCVALLAPAGVEFLNASETGGDVFLLTEAKLVLGAIESSRSIYDAHECTSASPCFPAPAEQPPACITEASCKAAPTPQPSLYGAPSSATFNGIGNLTAIPAPAGPAVQGKAVKCRRPERLSHGRCVKPKQKKRAKRQGRAKRSAHTDRRGKS